MEMPDVETPIAAVGMPICGVPEMIALSISRRMQTIPLCAAAQFLRDGHLPQDKFRLWRHCCDAAAGLAEWDRGENR
jgi:hypothetical protein